MLQGLIGAIRHIAGLSSPVRICLGLGALEISNIHEAGENRLIRSERGVLTRQSCSKLQELASL